MPEPWEEYTATQEVSPWEEFGQTAVAEPPAPSDLTRRLKEKQAFKEEQAIGEAAEAKANRLAIAEDFTKLLAPTSENPLGPIGGLFKSAQATGKVLGAAVTDIADLPSEIASNQLLRNLRAAFKQEPEPIPGRLGLTGQVAKGVAETAPVLAEQTMLTLMGIPPPVSGGIAFGGAAYAAGAPPAEIAKQTAFGVVLGPAQQWSKEATGKVLKETIARLPVPIPETALKAAEFTGSQTAVNALFAGMEAPAYVEAYKRNPKEAKDMLVQQVAMNLAFGVHDALGIRNPNVRSETIKAVYGDLRKMLDDLEVQKPISEKTPEQTQKDIEQAAKTLTERPADAIQEKVLKSAEDVSQLPHETPELHDISARTQAVERINRETAKDVEGKVRQRVVQASADWLEAIAKNDFEAQKNAAAQLSESEMGQAQLQRLEILYRSDRSRATLRTSDDYGKAFKKETQATGISPSQRRQRIEQQPGESEVGEPLPTQQTPQIDKEIEYALSQRSSKKISLDEASRGRGAVVEEVRQPETPADVQAQQAKAGEQPAPSEGKPALGDVAKALEPEGIKVRQLSVMGQKRWVVDYPTPPTPEGTTVGTMHVPEGTSIEGIKAEIAKRVPGFEEAKPKAAKPTVPPELQQVLKGIASQKEPGEVWLTHGEGGAESAGQGRSWWTIDPAKAISYGPNVWAVKVKASDLPKYSLAGKKGEFLLPDEVVKQAKELGTFKQPTFELEPAPAEPVKPTPEVPKPEPAKAAEVPVQERMIIRVGGSNRKLAKQAESAKSAGIDVRDLGTASLGIHHSNRHWSVPDTPEVREWIKANNATVPPKYRKTAESMRVGPGAAVPADVQSTQSDMAQLANTMENVSSPKKTATQRVAEAKQAVANLKTELPKNIAEMARNGVERLSAIGSAIKTGLTKLPEFTEFKKIMGQWLGANQQADLELRRFVKNINKTIPKDRQIAITNYIQADGDASVLRQRADASKTGKLRKGYEDALTLNRDEKIAADQIRVYLDNRLQEGIDSGILDHGLDNYITQIWKVPNPVTQKLISDISIGKLQPNFKFARQRLLESYFQGEQLGLVPANKAVSALIAAYDQSFNRSLAARAFIKNLTEGTASDGRPLVEVSGSGRLVGDEATTQAILVKSKTKPEEIADYRTIDHPALRKWKWATKTPEGTNVFVEGQLLVHPEIYSHLRNVLSRSAFRQYAFPRTVLRTERLIKELMFSASGFHQVQETLHALGHRVNPTNLETLDMSKPWLKEGVEHGLQIADYNALENFSEGLNTGPIISKIPLIGKRLLGPYTEWLFQDNIPRIKATMYKHAMQRNLERFDSQLRSGKITRDQVSELTAKQANAAFGELNYKWMGRNPTFQDALRTFLIAPDFLEARGRFVGQALKPYGREQLVALGLLAATQYITARILNQIFDKNPHLEPENAFKLIVGKHSYELRSVPGDILHLLSKPHQFATARISPLIRQAIEGITGRDWRGVKRDAWEQVKDFARLPTPISIRKEDDQRWWETFLNAFGVHERSYTAGQEIGDLARKYRESVKGKPAVEILEDIDSPYRKLRTALDVGNERDSIAALRELRQTRKDKQIYESMKSHLTAPFTGLSKVDEAKFRRSLQPVEMEKYREALAERRERFKKFQMIWSKRGPRTAP